MRVKNLTELRAIVRRVLKEGYELNVEPELNVVGDIRTEEISGRFPQDAQYANLNPTEEFIQKFYKFEEVKFNDGTVNNILKYWGEQGGWHPSSYNTSDRKVLKNRKFLRIV